MERYLESNRLELFHPLEEDAPLFDDIQGNPRVMRFIGRGARSKQDGAYLLEGALAHFYKFGFSLGSVRRKGHPKQIGQAGLYHFNLIETDPRIEIAFAFYPAYWGQGYATETVQALQQWAFEHINETRIVAVVNPKNKGSRAVLEKCGFVHTDMTSREGIAACYYEYNRPD